MEEAEARGVVWVQCSGHRERLVRGAWLRAFQDLRRKQMPVLTVANPHGSIMIGHGNEVIHIRPCWQVTDKLGHVQTSEHKTQKQPLNMFNSEKVGVTQQPLLCNRLEHSEALKHQLLEEWTNHDRRGPGSCSDHWQVQVRKERRPSG